MKKKLFVAAMLALLCLGCAAKDTEEQGKRLGTGLGAAVGAGALAAVGDPCAGMAVLVQGALEATGINEALGSLRGDEPDPKFIVFMEKLQRETEERRAARRLQEEAREAAARAAGENGATMDSAPHTGAVAANPENASPGVLERGAQSGETAGQAVAENTQ